MLTLLLIIPLIGALLLAPFQGDSLKSESQIKRLALGTSLIPFILSIILWGEFDSSTSEYQFTQEFNQLNFCHLHIGVDGISLYFVLLTTFITPICILSNWDNIKHSLKYFLMAFLVLETLLISVFVVLDLLLFYVFFESVLIPLFLIVGIWGGSATRVRAAFLLFLYTLFGSLFMLLAFLVIYYNVGSTDFQVVSLSEISLDSQKLLWLAVFISMAIKTPLVPFNTWLTYAHSEAPVGGSIVLAGVILKLSLYGYLRIMLPFFPDASHYFSPLVQTFAVISIVYGSLVTLRQTDFKKLIAYSSVAHMGVVVLGVFSNTVQGIEGAILLGIAHGLVSPALFFLVGGVLYDRFHTRTIRYYRGMTAYMPLFSVFFFVFTISNAAVPLTGNWIGEFMSLTGIFQKSPLVAVLGSTGIVLSAAYSIWLYNRISFGSYSKYLGYTTDLTRREFMLLLPLLVLTVLLGIFPNVVLENIHMSVSTLIYTTNLPLCDATIETMLYSSIIVGTKSDISDNKKGEKSSSGKSTYFEEVFEKDNGQMTNNPHIIAKRIMESNKNSTVKDVNAVLEKCTITTISEEDFKKLTSISSQEYDLPIKKGNRISILGSPREDPKRGIYIFRKKITGEKRVGSSMNLNRRYTEHISSTSLKASKILKSEFSKYGIENFSLTIFILPNNTSYHSLLCLEQYYLLLLKPTLNVVHTVNPLVGADNELNEMELLELQIKRGTPIYLYNKDGSTLLSVFDSRSQFAELANNGYKILHRYVDKKKAYKGQIMFTNNLLNPSDKPTLSKDQICILVKDVVNIPFDVSMRSISVTSNKLVINCTNTIDNSTFVIYTNSSRDAVSKLKAIEGISISRAGIDNYVKTYKDTNTPVLFSRKKNNFSLIVM